MTSPAAYRATFRADLAIIYEKLRPRTVGCFDLAELSLIPLDMLVRSGTSAWFVDGEAGRMKALLAGELARSNGDSACVACDSAVNGIDVCSAYAPKQTVDGRCCESREALPRAPLHCTRFVPGRRLRVIDGDARRGRGAAFATRVETVVAAASTPLDAVEEALVVCRRSAQLDVPLPLEDGALDLVISVLAPAHVMEQPYGYFCELMRRRFGTCPPDQESAVARRLDVLQLTLFRTQLEAHVRELARLTDPRHGRMYFATLPVEAADGAWLLDRSATECLDALGRYFAFDFETFPAESFLRRSTDDRAIVLQAALLRPKPKEARKR